MMTRGITAALAALTLLAIRFAILRLLHTARVHAPLGTLGIPEARPAGRDWWPPSAPIDAQCVEVRR